MDLASVLDLLRAVKTRILTAMENLEMLECEDE
jgi:hypothetical protein